VTTHHKDYCAGIESCSCAYLALCTQACVPFHRKCAALCGYFTACMLKYARVCLRLTALQLWNKLTCLFPWLCFLHETDEISLLCMRQMKKAYIAWNRWNKLTFRVGQNRIYAPYMTVYLVISLPKIPYIHRIYMVLAKPTYFAWDRWNKLTLHETDELSLLCMRQMN